MVLVGLVLFPIFARQRPNRDPLYCQSQLKQIGLAMFQYTQDYHGKFPAVNLHDTGIGDQNAFGWADALFPYLKSHQIFWCPAQLRNGVRDDQSKPPAARNYTDYFYNRRMDGLHNEKIESVILTIMLGDGNDGTDAANARYSLSKLPSEWREDKNSPSYRHREGANYLFADGHVKLLKPEQVSVQKVITSKPNQITATFSID